MKIAWLTDIHVDSLCNINVDTTRFKDLLRNVVPIDTNATLITGDISHAGSLVYTLSVIESVLQHPVYYVLGNHDFWGSSFDSVRHEAAQLNAISTYLKYVPASGSVRLTETTMLVAVDGWYDASASDPFESRFLMNDWPNIRDIRESSVTPSLVKKCQEFSRASVVQLHKYLLDIIRGGCKNVIVATHVPPFAEAHRYKGKQPSETMCWYVNSMLGTLLQNAAKTHPGVNFTVFCGHTHERCDVSIANNLHVHVGAAEYGVLKLQDVIEVK